MLDYLLGDPRHVRWFPSKYIFICPEESNELKFLLRRKVGPDIGGLVPSCDLLRLRSVIWLVCDHRLFRVDHVDLQRLRQWEF